MPKTPLYRLHRARYSTLDAIESAEMLLFLYRERLTKVEKAIRRLSPVAPLEARIVVPSPIFKRGEIGRMTMDCLRGAMEPISILVITLAILRAKGFEAPDALTRRITRRAINVMMPSWEKRGLVKRHGRGNQTKWGLAD